MVLAWAVVVAVLVGALVGCTPAPSDPPASAPLTTVEPRGDPLTAALEHSPVLDDLGIPDLATVRLGRRFHTGFENPADLASFYVTPQSALTHHGVTAERVHSGTAAYRAWVTGVGGPGLERDGPNHRGKDYPHPGL